MSEKPSGADIRDMVKLLEFTISAKNYTAIRGEPSIPLNDHINKSRIAILIDTIPAANLIALSHHQSPLSMAIDLGDNETALQIINKKDMPLDELVNGAGCLQHAKDTGNKLVVAAILQKLSPQQREEYIEAMIEPYAEEIEKLNAAIKLHHETNQARSEMLRLPEDMVQRHAPEMVADKQITIQ